MQFAQQLLFLLTTNFNIYQAGVFSIETPVFYERKTYGLSIRDQTNCGLSTLSYIS